MAPRQTLHDMLKAITPRVYFQPPANVAMQYPCIRYERNGSDNDYAGNLLYRHAKRYSVTVIDRDPDSTLPDQVEALQMCELDQFFTSDDLNHWVFTLFH